MRVLDIVSVLRWDLRGAGRAVDSAAAAGTACRTIVGTVQQRLHKPRMGFSCMMDLFLIFSSVFFDIVCSRIDGHVTKSEFSAL